MINIAICDDDKSFARKVGEDLARLAQAANLSCEMQIFHDGQKLVDSVNSGVFFDLIFLDIEMGSMDGLKAASEIRKIDKAVLIIYCSSHSEYAVEAYDVNPFRFLVKPPEATLLEKYFAQAIAEIIEDDAYFRYRDDKQSFKVPLKDILYFESDLRNVNIVLSEKVYSYHEKLSRVEETLKQNKVDFWRIHQSFLVNRRHIWRTKYSEIEMSNGTVLPISKGRRKYIREKYLDQMDSSMLE